MFKVIDTTADDAPAEARPKRRRSRRNVWRDGLAAHSVIAGLEDAKSYRAFERAIIASFESSSAIEHGLILRLASLFWRLRRATAIETALLQRDVGGYHAVRAEIRTHEGAAAGAQRRLSHRGHRQRGIEATDTTPTTQKPASYSDSPSARKIAESFWRLAVVEFDPFERLGAYEARLWRQAAQTIWTLDALRRPSPTAARRPSRKPLASYFWNRDG